MVRSGYYEDSVTVTIQNYNYENGILSFDFEGYSYSYYVTEY